MTIHQLIEEMEKECPNCGDGKFGDIDTWKETSQSKAYYAGKPGQKPIISQSVCPVCGRVEQQRLKVKEIISSLEK